MSEKEEMAERIRQEMGLPDNTAAEERLRSGNVKVGDKLPLPKRKLDIRPNAPIDNRPSFSPSRKA